MIKYFASIVLLLGSICLFGDEPVRLGPLPEEILQRLGITNVNQLYIPGPRPGQSRQEWISSLRVFREGVRFGMLSGKPVNRAIYQDPEKRWLEQAFTCEFAFMYDRSFWDPAERKYKLDAYLKDGQREFGGYDAILLWHAYPRIGLDERNQFDFYRDMPGGLEALRRLSRAARGQGTRVLLNYNPWDLGTRREGVADEEALADLLLVTEADGLFLDTMSGISDAFAAKLQEGAAKTVLCPELHPSITNLYLCNGSWAQGMGPEFIPAAVDLRKWVEPRHMRWHIDRWSRDHTEEIRRAVFNGAGMLIWENVFGSFNPWTQENRVTWKRAAAILHYFPTAFSSDTWEPFYTLSSPNLAGFPGTVYCSRWNSAGVELFTLLARPGTNQAAAVQGSFRVQVQERTFERGMRYFDLWNGREVLGEPSGDRLRLSVEIDPAVGIGCFIAIREYRADRHFRRLLEYMLKQRAVGPDRRAFAKDDSMPLRKVATVPLPATNPPAGMVLVPGGTVRMRVEHTRRECGCYPDPGAAPDKRASFHWGDPFHAPLVHDYTVEVKPFLIDEAEVSNAEFAKFMAATHYRPRHPENFLKHWPGGKMSEGSADLPVVWVDLQDARAYTKWARKRLPREEEWQLAAQGTDGRKWPWGGEMDQAKPDAKFVNTTGSLLPVRSLPDGKSPYGCYHMSGNAYEWTESERDDGHTRYAIIRGGSYFQAQGSIWYVDGGARPCTHHAKCLLMWPGLDRCSTVGFRCVKDVL